jgi:hypothetical protein
MIDPILAVGASFAETGGVTSKVFETDLLTPSVSVTVKVTVYVPPLEKV